MSNIAIKAENISKYYRLGQINSGMLYKDIQTWLALKMGREDPNAKIGQNQTYEKSGFWALKDINFEINQGDRVGIIGKNGAGKSTLLKVISEVTAPTTGDIKIKGRIASLLEVGTGFHPEMTGRENVYMNGAILGMKRAEINAKMDEIIAFSEIEKHIDTPVKRYSSGMYVRLAFAVAANLDSEILIADEVLAVGDATFQKKALGKMNEVSSKEGRTVLFVSHQMNAVRSLCNNGIVLDHGQIVYTGDVESSIQYYQQDLYDSQETAELSTFNNEFFDLLEFDIVDEKGASVTGSVQNNTTNYVKISFDMHKTHTAFNMGYALYDKSMNLVYWSYSVDRYDEYQDVHTGVNTILGEIPPHFLNEDTYYIKLISSIHYQQWLVNPAVDSPTLRLIIEGGLSNSPFWTIKRPGACAPLLHWNVLE